MSIYFYVDYTKLMAYLQEKSISIDEKLRTVHVLDVKISLKEVPHFIVEEQEASLLPKELLDMVTKVSVHYTHKGSWRQQGRYELDGAVAEVQANFYSDKTFAWDDLKIEAPTYDKANALRLAICAGTIPPVDNWGGQQTFKTVDAMVAELKRLNAEVKEANAKVVAANETIVQLCRNALATEGKCSDLLVDCQKKSEQISTALLYLEAAVEEFWPSKDRIREAISYLRKPGKDDHRS